MNKDFIIKNGVLKAYRGTGGNVIIPNSVKSIEERAFAGYTSLKSVTIHDGVIDIGEYAFFDCGNLTSVTIPDSVTSIRAGAFSNCTNLTSVTIPDNAISIGDVAFYDCINLKNITIPDSVTNIGRYAFGYCTNLKSVTIPDSVMDIGEYAFFDCKNLMSNNKKLRFKATDGYMRCRGFQYSLGEWFEIDGKIELCNRGFHSCKDPTDVFNYYGGELGKDIRLWLVETDGEIKENKIDSKVVSKRIRFIKELTISELAGYTK